MVTTSEAYGKNVQARRLFNGIAGRYEGPAEVLSLFQYGRWRRFLVSQLALSARSLVLDVCTGTGLVAAEVARRGGGRVVGVDLSGSMIEQARQVLRASGQTSSVGLAKGRAESLPFRDGTFDTVVFTFLLRYVEDPQATLRELARVLRPGGQMASLEFSVPRGPALYPLWLLHTRLVLPWGTRYLSPGWREVGPFLGRSITEFYDKYPLDDQVGMWELAGIGEVQKRVLSLGGAVTMWGRKEARSEG